MPTFDVKTADARYPCIAERGVLRRSAEFLPARSGHRFIVTSREIWDLHRDSLDPRLAADARVLFLPAGETNKRLAQVEALAEQMLEKEADRTSVVIGFGGGVVTDVSGFLAAIFMRGVPVVQIPTTLLAQVDAAIGGKTGVNLVNGKNLVGSFHQPCAVLIDPEVLKTLPPREYRAGLFEVIKSAIIRDPRLFELLQDHAAEILANDPALLDELIAASVRIKTEVVSADEREGDLRRILNFGHTVGHAIESETEYRSYLHGEAVAWGMLVAIRLAELHGELNLPTAERMRQLIASYGPIPSAANLDPDRLIARLASDKKTLQGRVHFILPVAIGEVKVVSGIDRGLIRQAIVESLN